MPRLNFQPTVIQPGEPGFEPFGIVSGQTGLPIGTKALEKPGPMAAVKEWTPQAPKGDVLEALEDLHLRGILARVDYVGRPGGSTFWQLTMQDGIVRRLNRQGVLHFRAGALAALRAIQDGATDPATFVRTQA